MHLNNCVFSTMGAQFFFLQNIIMIMSFGLVGPVKGNQKGGVLAVSGGGGVLVG